MRTLSVCDSENGTEYNNSTTLPPFTAHNYAANDALPSPCRTTKRSSSRRCFVAPLPLSSTHANERILTCATQPKERCFSQTAGEALDDEVIPDCHREQTSEFYSKASASSHTNQISSTDNYSTAVELDSTSNYYFAPQPSSSQQRLFHCKRRKNTRGHRSFIRWQQLPCNKLPSSATYFCIVNMFLMLFLTLNFTASALESPSFITTSSASPVDVNAILQQISPDLITNQISSVTQSPFIKKSSSSELNTISESSSLTTAAAPSQVATTTTTGTAQAVLNAPEHDKVHLNVNVFERILKLRLRKVPHPQEHPSFKVLVGDVVNGRPVFTDASEQVTKKNITHALYQDPENMAAVRISYLPQLNTYQVEGVIGNDLVIHPYDPAKHAHLLSSPKSRRIILSAPNVTDGQSIVDDEALIEPPSTANLTETLNSTTNGEKGHWLSSPQNAVSTAAARRALKMQVHHVDANGSPINSLDNNKNILQPDGPNLLYHIITQQHHRPEHEQLSLPSQFTRPTTDDYAMIQDYAAGGPVTPSSNMSLAQRAKRQVSPDKIPTTWPEILLIVDYETFRMHEGDEERITNYFTTFWNAVDLRYRAQAYPDIRLHLTGLIISRDPQFLPFIEENRMPAPEDDAFDSKQALSDMGKHLFYYQTELPDFDMAMLITKLDMCRRKGKHGKCHRGTAGFAYVGGACHVDEKRKKFNKVGIVEDSGGFSGIIVSAHEVGHLLGAVHDGSAAPSYLGGPGATACLWEDGYIMSDLRHDERGFQWSTCTKEQFIHFLSRSQAQCLFNIPRTGVKFSDKLPGKTISLDWQCRLDRGSTACFKDTRVCTQLYCHDKATGYCIAFRPAAEGSACGQGVHCIDGQCVPEQQAIRSRTRKHLASGSDRAHSANTISDGGSIPIPRSLRSSSAALREQRSSKNGGGGGVCRRDVPGVRISGLPCAEFMQRTSNAFCDHYDVKRYCCSTRRSMCFGGGVNADVLQQRLFQQQQLQFVPPDSPNGDEVFSAFGGSDHAAIMRVPANDVSGSSSSSSSSFDSNQFFTGGTNGGSIEGAPSVVSPTTGSASGFVNEI